MPTFPKCGTSRIGLLFGLYLFIYIFLFNGNFCFSFVLKLRVDMDSRTSVDGGQQLQRGSRPEKSTIYPFSISRVSLIFKKYRVNFKPRFESIRPNLVRFFFTRSH